MTLDKNQTELEKFFREFEDTASNVKDLYEDVYGYKDRRGEKEGIRDRVEKLEKRVKDPSQLQDYLTDLISSEIERKLEKKRKEIIASIYKISTGFAAVVTFLITTIIPFLKGMV